MNLKRLRIENFRSIKKLVFDIEKLEDQSYTYGLIGVNEAGKSSVLKALALKDTKSALTIKDFNNKDKNIEIEFIYEITDEQNSWYQEYLSPSEDDENDEEIEIDRWDELRYSLIYSPTGLSAPVLVILLYSNKHKVSRVIDEDILGDDDVQRCIFWTAEEKYLISKPISLSAFSANPETTSIPLKNCFALAGYEDAKAAVVRIQNDPSEQYLLQQTLSDAVTKHISRVWPSHPISISFLINSDTINFLVKDEGSLHPKTADQRSDGFKQFVSFLLTVSAEDKNEQLRDSILLLDEPETHLHPQAQQQLLKELKSITANSRNIMVLFATHSNYMIDKDFLHRNYRVIKNKGCTELERLDIEVSTYASVTYEVFEILSNDYHNELYGKLHENYIDEDLKDDKRSQQKYFDTKFFHERHKLEKNYPLKGENKAATLPTYVRNCINHPEAGKTFTEAEIKQSIYKLRELISLK